MNFDGIFQKLRETLLPNQDAQDDYDREADYDRRNVRPASEDPYGDPADYEQTGYGQTGDYGQYGDVRPASEDPYGDPADYEQAGYGQYGDIRPASEDPYGDPADDDQYR